MWCSVNGWLICCGVYLTAWFNSSMRCSIVVATFCYCILLYLVFFIPLPHFQYREDIYAHPCFQVFPKQFTYDYLSNHLYGQEARKVFIQHPRFNIEVFLKRTKDGRSIIHRHWPKVAKTFNMNEGSIVAFRFNSFLDEMHLSIYHLWC